VGISREEVKRAITSAKKGLMSGHTLLSMDLMKIALNASNWHDSNPDWVRLPTEEPQMRLEMLQHQDISSL
jgi:hypothetical protein